MTTTNEALRMAGVAIDGLDLIERWTRIGGKPAEEVLAAIKAALAVLRSGTDGAVTPQVVQLRLDELHAKIAADNTAADAELAKKFDTGGPTP